jgi:RimJ/RimL family protein N-acetyltransferase
MVQLLEATDAHFAWMLDEGPPCPGPDGVELTLPPGGIEGPFVLRWLRGCLDATPKPNCWLMIDRDDDGAGEVVGAISFKGAVNAAGAVEIGYGVAPERRRRGYATLAIGALIELAAHGLPALSLTAETSVDNLPSQLALERNRFERVGERMDDEDGALVQWRRAVLRTG